MILKSLKLENIRSYKQHEVSFLPGTTLFEGDIGCGKTTLLMAIEFALFGLGSEKAGALLRTSESKGSVTLQFEIDGEEYEIQRTLVKKGKSIRQVEGYIKIKDEKLHLSVSELKEKALEVLNFNEPPDPKAQSNIYRYAVFTPQEEMKTILVMNADARLQTLRKAFRIEDYKTARDNAHNHAAAIEKRADILRATASDINEKKKTLNAKLQEISKDGDELKFSVSEERRYDDLLRDLKKQQGDLKGERDKLGKVEGEIPEIEKQIREKNGSLDGFSELVKRAQEKITRITSRLEQACNVNRSTGKSQETLTKELSELKKEQRELVGKKGTIESKIQEYQEVEQKGVCPTCDREAAPEDFKHKIEQKRSQLAQVDTRLKECDSAIAQIEQQTKELERYEEAQRMIKDCEEQLGEQKQFVEENDQKMKTCKEDIDTLKKRLQEANQELEKFKEVSEQLQRLDVDVETANKTFKAAAIQVSSMKAKIEESKKRVAELEAEVRSKEENVKKADLLSEFAIWLRDYFIPTVENIEKHVLITIHQEFNQLFQHWFSLLVEDPTKDALVDEDFTPIVEQDGYEQDVHYLSGGERTSIALAYRLALNMLVRKVSTSMKSGLLILDEPTDGFSKEQLFKIRDILKELQCPQIVIVSHEKELENFADQVFKVTKVNGVSSVGS